MTAVSCCVLSVEADAKSMAFPSKNEAPSPSKAPAAQEDEDLMGVYPWKSHENLLGGFNVYPSEK